MRDCAERVAPMLTWEGLPSLFPGFEEALRWLPLLERHAALVAEASARVRVTAVPGADAVQRHYAESLELLRIADEAGWAGEICDVGSGGGYPGIVMAVMRPGTRVHLVEPLQKRARLLESMAAELGLENVRVYAARAEGAGRGPLRDHCGLVTARAVAELREVLEYTAPLARDGALIALPKGSALESELEAARRAMEELGVDGGTVVPMNSLVSDRIHAVLLRKHGATPPKYPRREGIPGKRPL
jgi:16S rRNA (guanine527-N7)-methyltransferase